MRWGERIGDELVSVERGEMEVRWGVVSKVSKGEGLVRIGEGMVGRRMMYC